MIARPDDDAADRGVRARRLDAELHRIETADGQLDRHRDFEPDTPRGKTLDALRSPMLEAPPRFQRRREDWRALLGHVGAALALLAVLAIGSVAVSWIVVGLSDRYTSTAGRLAAVTHIPEWIVLPVVPLVVVFAVGVALRRRRTITTSRRP